jgi:hypothetical protein
MADPFQQGSLERDQVLAYAFAVARRSMPTPELASVLETALIGLHEHARRADRPFIIDLPLSVYAAIRGERAPGIPIAAAIALMYLGFDIGDDLTDGDLPPHWQGRSVAEIEIIMVALVASLPATLIDALDVPAEVRARMQGGFGARLMTMLGGCQRESGRRVGRGEDRGRIRLVCLAGGDLRRRRGGRARAVRRDGARAGRGVAIPLRLP